MRSAKTIVCFKRNTQYAVRDIKIQKYLIKKKYIKKYVFFFWFWFQIFYGKNAEKYIKVSKGLAKYTSVKIIVLVIKVIM